MTDPHEQALVDRLAAEGLLNRQRRPRLRPALVLLALAGAFWLGLAWPRLMPGGAPEGRQYVLLLYEGPAFRSVPGGHAAEYGAWARAAHADGRVIGGGELGGTPASLGPPAGAAPPPAGFFIVTAPDSAAALRLARTCPHLRHGGTIAVRALGD